MRSSDAMPLAFVPSLCPDASLSARKTVSARPLQYQFCLCGRGLLRTTSRASGNWTGSQSDGLTGLANQLLASSVLLESDEEVRSIGKQATCLAPAGDLSHRMPVSVVSLGRGTNMRRRACDLVLVGAAADGLLQ